MERLTSERIKTAEQHAQTLLRSLEQLKEGSIDLLGTDQSLGPRESLPRKAKGHKKEKKDPTCSCGNVASAQCETKNCINCCTNSSCGFQPHAKKQMTNSEKRRKARYYESDNSSDESSDEDVPLANVKRKKTNDEKPKQGLSRGDSESTDETDEEWTPYTPTKKKNKHRRGNHSDMAPSLHATSQQASVPASTSHHHTSANNNNRHVSSAPSLPTTHLNLPVLPSTREQHILPRPWLPNERRMPTLTSVIPNIYSHKPSGLSQPTTTCIRLPLLPSTRQQPQCRLLPTTQNTLSSSRMSTSLEKTQSSLEASPYNSHQIYGSGQPKVDQKPELSHIDKSNCNKRPTDSSKENKEDSILMFYVRYPHATYCDQRRVVDLFRPYCSLRFIQWVDKRSAYVTISDDSTFHTYDTIYMNLVMKSDYENQNSLYVSPYNEYIKIVEKNCTKNEKI